MSTVHPARRAEAGFTLIELMVVVAIIGLLSSIAIPQFNRATLRSRAAERATVMTAVARAMNDVIANGQKLPTSPANWVGVANPSGAPASYKRRFDYGAVGWTILPMVVEGDCYYSYQFLAMDPGGLGQNVTASVVATGDLDGDGAPSTKIVNYDAIGYVLKKNAELPPAGAEDTVTFGTF